MFFRAHLGYSGGVSRSSIAIAVAFAALLGCRRAPEELPPPSTVESAQSNLGKQPAAPSVPASASARVRPEKAKNCPKDPEGSSMLPTLPITFAEASAKLEAEIAKNEHDVTRGLMYRTEMADDHGMLFKMPQRQEQIFWMRNTCIPLDMLFLDDDGTVVGVLSDVPVLNEEQRTVGKPSRYVLETNAGWAEAHGVRAGMKAKLPL